MVIDKGRIVGEGRHEELLAKNGVLSGCMKVSFAVEEEAPVSRLRRKPGRGLRIGLPVFRHNRASLFKPSDLRSSLREFLYRVPPVAGSLGC